MKDETMFNKNLFGISFLRILSTFLVIVIHVSGPLVIKYGSISMIDWHVANVFDSFSRFSIPMFFMISGALLLHGNDGLKDFLSKRFWKIIPPFLFWSLTYSLLNRYVFNNEAFNLKKMIRDIFHGSEYHLWFVFVLLGIYLATPILRKWIKHATQHEILYVLILWIITLIIGMPWLKNYAPKINLSFFTGYIGYFILGHYLSTIHFKSRFIPILFIALGLFITVFGTYYFTAKNMLFYHYFYEYLCLNTLLVSFGVFVLFNKISAPNAHIKTFFFKLNQCSFGMYLIHPLILQLLALAGINETIFNPFASILIVSTSCFLFSFLVIFCLRKLKYGYLIA